MTLKLSGLDASKIFVSGVPAKRVMLGTGSSAVEVWPGIEDVNYDFTFPNQDHLKWAPLTGFDGRTHASSPRNPGWVYSGMFVAGDNNYVSYNTRLLDRQLDGDTTTWLATMGNNLSPLSRPAYIVLASNPSMTNMFIVEFGNNGVRWVKIVNRVETASSVASTSLSNNDVLYIGRSKNALTIRKNGTLVVGWNVSLDEFFGIDGRMYTGFGLYSANNVWATRISRVEIYGSTSYPTVLIASEALARLRVNAGVWTEVCRATIHTGGVTDIRLIGADWGYARSNLDRKFRIKLNGSVVHTGVDEGRDIWVTNRTIPPNSNVTVEAYAVTANAGYRDVTNGVLHVGKSMLFV